MERLSQERDRVPLKKQSRLIGEEDDDPQKRPHGEQRCEKDVFLQ
jgi:hypothetical protein